MAGREQEEGPRFAEGLTERAGRDEFRFCAASDDAIGTVVGFAYGFTGRPGQVWRDSMAAALGPEVAGEWLTGHCEFAEFGVVPAWRGWGSGARC
jgi:GNAT superfamily N-acetyltransferase